ncbi:MAG: MarR family winged helix-turn-helix transcriptional regulator [Streptosporangiaceae bacterium]
MNQDTVQLGTVQPGPVQAGAGQLDQAPPRQQEAQRPESAPGDLERAEAGLSVLIEAWQRAIEELGAMLPPAQVRALLIVDTRDSLNVTGLARMLGASPSATSRLCDRLVAAGLLARVPAAASRREILLQLTESGQRLAAWIRDQRGTALVRVLETISPGGRAGLARGLSELAAGLAPPPPVPQGT